MLDNKQRWTKDNNPLSTEQFHSLMADQILDGCHTDQNGFFIEGTAQYLQIEMKLLLTKVQTPLLENGMGGPYITINEQSTDSEKPVFYYGLLQNESQTEGKPMLVII